MKKLIFLLTCILAYANAVSGIVEQVSFQAQPLISLQNGNINGCGVRLISSKLSTVGNQKSYAIDVSFNFYTSLTSIVKGGLLEFDAKTISNNKDFNPVQIKMFWIKSSTNKATHPISNKISTSESPLGYIFYETELDSVLHMFNNVIDKNQFMVGFRRKSENIDRIFSGKVSLDDSEIKQIQDCTSELFSNIKKYKPGSGSSAN